MTDLLYHTEFNTSIPMEQWGWSNLDDFLYYTDMERGTSHRDDLQSDIYEEIDKMNKEGTNPRMIAAQVASMRYKSVAYLYSIGELSSIPPHPDDVEQ